MSIRTIFTAESHEIPRIDHMIHYTFYFQSQKHYNTMYEVDGRTFSCENCSSGVFLHRELYKLIVK